PEPPTATPCKAMVELVSSPPFRTRRRRRVFVNPSISAASMTEQRKILVTSALPYANGSIHLGHMVEAVQTDIWVRFQNMRAHDCSNVCADDAHGTAIMLTAEKLGITPEQQIANMQAEHQKDFADFLIGFDNYHSTHSIENKTLSELIY